MADFHHGIKVIEVASGPRPVRTISTAVIGVVCTGPTAEATAFPLNVPVLVTDIYAAIAKAGTDGTLPSVLKAIVEETRAIVVVVRVAPGVDAAATNTAVIGTVVAETGQKTGLQALLTAEQRFGIKPRILGAPGLDTAPVATALGTLAEKLRAFAYVSASGCATKEAALEYAEDFSAREMMVIWPDWQVFNTTTSATETLPAVAKALGLRAKIDNDIGWHKTLSNMPINGVTGISKDVFFDLQDSATDAGVLNEAGITTLVNKNGFRFWGNRTAASTGESQFIFENYTRTSQVIADTIAEAHLWALDRPMHPSLAKDVIEGINAKFRDWTRRGYLLGGSAWLDPELNTPAVLQAGQMYIDYDYTPVPPLENLMLQQRFTDRYLVDFADRVTA